MKTLTKGNLEDYIDGATILSCGGGGTAEAGRAIVEDAFEKGFEFKLADIDELPDEAFLCILDELLVYLPLICLLKLLIFLNNL